MQEDVFMDKKALNRSLRVIRARLAGFIELIKTNKKAASAIGAAVLIVIVVFAIACSSCSAARKNKKTEPSTNEPSQSVVQEPVTSEPPTSAAEGQGKYKVTLENTDTLNLRLIPSSTSSDTKIIATIPNSTELNVQFVYNGWGFVEYGDYSGWVSMEFLTPIK